MGPRFAKDPNEVANQPPRTPNSENNSFFRPDWSGIAVDPTEITRRLPKEQASSEELACL